MIGHYVVGTLRAFRQRKTVTLINLLCLALGLAAFIVAYSVVRYLETAEQHFVNADRTYIVSTKLIFPDEQPPLNTLVTPEHAAKYVKEEFPELEAVVRVMDMGDTAVAAGGEKANVLGAVTDPGFLEVFNLEFVAGNASTALSQTRSVVITETLARRLFGSTNALGNKLIFDGVVDVTVTGVIAALPKSSSFDFELLATWDVVEAYRAVTRPPRPGQPPRELWLNLANTRTYALLPPSSAMVTAESFPAGLSTFSAKYVPEDQKDYYQLSFNAVPLSSLKIERVDQMLFSNLDTEVSITTLLVLLGGLILGLACINYANLSTVQAADRFKELGTRRVVGATSRDVLLQSLSQTAVHSAIALTAAIVLVMASAPLIDQALDVEIRKVAFSDVALWLFIPVLMFVVTVAGGTYVAFMSARVAPGRALRSSTQEAPGISRTLMVGAQFAAACLLLVMVTVMDRQTQALRSNALQPSEESVVLIGNDLTAARVGFDVYKSAYMSLPGVQGVSAMVLRPWSADPSVNSASRGPAADAPILSINPHSIEQDFFAILQIPLLAGRTLDAKFGADLAAGGRPPETGEPTSIVIDRALSEAMGYADPREAIDQLLYDPPLPPTNSWRPYRVVGVVENRVLAVQNHGGMGNVYNLAARTPVPLLRISTQDLPDTLGKIAETWDELAPNIPSDIRFLDAIFDEGYRTFRTTIQFLNGLMLLAVGIAVGGLIAMSVHEIQHRFHEIAVRKTLGAHTKTIAWNLLRRFTVPVLLGNLVALPLAYIAANAYLQMFSFRIDLSIWPFVSSIAITLLVAWLALGFLTLRAARLNPATVLRYE